MIKKTYFHSSNFKLNSSFNSNSNPNFAADSSFCKKGSILSRVNIFSILALTCLSFILLNFMTCSANHNSAYALEQALETNNHTLLPTLTNPLTASDPGIMPLSNSAPSISLSIGGTGGTNSIVTAAPGDTVYSSHTITMGTTNGENLASYALSISAPTSLSGSNGGTLTGAGGKTGSSMSNNTWGYYYNKDGTTSDSSRPSATYSSFTGSNQSLESGTGAPSTTTKSLILAAKFGAEGSGTEAGHYSGTVKLSLTATPKTLIAYSITYNANSGSGAPSTWSTTDYNTSYSATISSTTPTRDGYNFLGWSTSSSASSASYSAGQSVTLSSSSPTLNLYAVWQLKSVTHYLTLNANSGSGGPGSQSCTATGTSTSCSITISSTKPARSGYTFQGWGTSSSTSTVSYNPGNSITMSGNRTLYAVWKANPTTYTYSITYNANGGSNAPSYWSTTSTSTSYSTTISSTTPTRAGYDFQGWSTSSGATSATYSAGQSITLNSSIGRQITLYAVWKVKAQTFTYTVTYDCDGGTPCPSDFSTTSTEESYSYTVPNSIPQKPVASGKRCYLLTSWTGSRVGNSSIVGVSEAFSPFQVVTIKSSHPTIHMTAVYSTALYDCRESS